ncbi:MAG: hypothetical protein JW836_16775 [Deltaproteobacteria bacterium]|nr:hypothetical protein [Deltaproteobacteria bacterium]
MQRLEYFFGGNFVQSNDEQAEVEMMDYVLSISPTYNRFLNYAHEKHSEKIIEVLKGNPRVNLITDSGAYSGLEDVDGYMDFLRENGKFLDYYVNVDVLNEGERSWKNYLRMRKEGFDPIPVWHAGTNEKYLLRYLSETNYVGIGGIAGKRFTTRKTIEILDPIFSKHLLDKDGYPKNRYHAFGLTWEVLRRYPFRSADSTDWVFYSGELTAILVPKSRDGQWDFLQNPRSLKVGTQHEKLDGHLLNPELEIRQEVRRYLQENKFRYGLFTYENGERVDIIDGLYNLQAMRDRVNALFCIRFAQSLPPWPWPFKVKT